MLFSDLAKLFEELFAGGAAFSAWRVFSVK